MSLDDSLTNTITERLEDDEILISTTLTTEPNNTLTGTLVKREKRSETEPDEESDLVKNLADSQVEDIELTDTALVNAAQAALNSFTNDWIVTNQDQEHTDITVDTPKLVFFRETWGIRADFELSSTNTDWIQDFSQQVTEASPMIDSPDLLREMTVRIALTDDIFPFDYTIYFATDEPHKYWSDCETIEDYFEMAAEHNDNTTIEELRNKDEYLSHTHLMNKQNKINDWFRAFVTGLTTQHFTTNNELIDINPTQFHTEFNGYTLNGSITQDL